MKTIVFVTSNKGKAWEVKKILKRLTVKVKPIDLDEAKHLSHENLVRKKARDAFKAIRKPVVVESYGRTYVVSGHKEVLAHSYGKRDVKCVLLESDGDLTISGSNRARNHKSIGMCIADFS